MSKNTIKEITQKEWEDLISELEEYDKRGEVYDPEKSQLLTFVLQQIQNETVNYFEIPLFVRMHPLFLKIAVKNNDQLWLEIALEAMRVEREEREKLFEKRFKLAKKVAFLPLLFILVFYLILPLILCWLGIL